MTNKFSYGDYDNPDFGKIIKDEVSLKWKGEELHLYDFDGTLFKTPEYQPKWWRVQKDWSWFKNPVSMTEPCIPLNPSSDWWIESTVKDAEQSETRANVVSILCTGRVETHKPRVKALLKRKGLMFDYLFFNTGISAKLFKTTVMMDLFKKHNFSVVHIWENENMGHYKDFVEKELGIPCIIHEVREQHHDYECNAQTFGYDEITDEDQIPRNLRVASRLAMLKKKIQK